ncbi:N-6 DNA methylase [Nocardiopsis sp. HUAS JQ3]|uniref:N-6 DNA methylase n=1 Tax=Nocardiopsis sp. HUAS JQ3 TaxID=3061629 RepID=UPI0023A9A745|nr:N-6 DNA methylase [Nocardiopsis sp. HUAS JQ3]WDZ88927.1 N-6 DNA methylase [Nocardiopsis sp. HUAS JQ3]
MDSREQAPAEEQQVTAADIARLAGVTRAAVSNWRRRHEDFPAPSGGTASSPLFELAGVRGWLERQNKVAEESPEVRLWRALRGDYPGRMLQGLADTAEYLRDGRPGALSATARELADALSGETSPGQVSAALAARFLDSGERSGTPFASTARLVRAVSSLTSCEAATVFDPACGTGALLLAVGAPDAGRTGQDADPDAARLSHARAALERGKQAEVRVGDSLRSDRWPDHQAELVVCDPPPATADWGREELLMDPRWELALPPRAEGELAWLQHAYAHTAPGGQTAVVLSTSCAYRRTGRRIRAELVRRGLLTDVVALPAGLAATHSQPVHLWLLRRPLKGSDNASSVRMWDLTSTAPDGPWELTEETGAEISLIDLLDEEVNLNPARHVGPDLSELPEAFARTRAALERLAEEMRDVLPALDAGSAEPIDARVRVSDLLDAGMAEVDGDTLRSSSEQVDTDFLNGFLRSPSNNRRSTSSSGTFRTDARAARVPKMGVGDQRRYGAAFRAVAGFEQRAREFAALAAKAAELAREGLTSGALKPETTVPDGTSASEAASPHS